MAMAMESAVPDNRSRELEASLRQALSERNAYGLDWSRPWVDAVFAAYRQPHRHFHTLEHLHRIVERIRQYEWEDVPTASRMLLTALFHDVVWYPLGGDSERRSAAAFEHVMGLLGEPLPADDKEQIRRTILSTFDQTAEDDFAARFHDYDCQVIIHGSRVDLIDYEAQIFREFQCLNMADYRRGRSAFFQRFARRYPRCQPTMEFLIEYLERRRPRVGIYAGTFNPFHIGHLSILEKAELIFDKVILALGINPQKKHLERDRQLDRILPFHEVVTFDTLIVDLIGQESRYANVTLVRGLRNGYDLDYEMNQLSYMQDMRPGGVQTVYIPCDKRLEHVSSSMLNGLRQFDTHGMDSIYYPHKYDYASQTLQEQFG